LLSIGCSNLFELSKLFAKLSSFCDRLRGENLGEFSTETSSLKPDNRIGVFSASSD